MKCKACNVDIDPHYRVEKETGMRILEDMCHVCRRWVYAIPKRTDEDDAREWMSTFLGARRVSSEE